jgi:hypothetical protein
VASANNYLNSVTALSARDAWAVGYFQDSNGGGQNTLIEHWNGTVWSIIPSPNPISGSNFLSEVARVPGTTTVWAVGHSYSSDGSTQTLTEYWNGTSWNVVTSPNTYFGLNSLSSIVALSTNNVWAVGYTISQTLIEHWNGTMWAIVSSPNAATYSYLYDVTAFSASNIWAVGYSAASNEGGPSQTLIERWNGRTWNVVSSPNVGGGNSLVSIAQVPGTSQIWAVGYSDNNTLTEFSC